MILNLIFGSLAVLSLALTLWQWLVARRFPLHQRVAASPLDPQPPLTLLKPLKGCDPATADCLRSWFRQAYAGPTQLLFGVAEADDPVCGIVRALQQEFPGTDAQLVVGNSLPGANAKVAKLVELERLARHDLLVISDADVRVPPDFLANIVAPLGEVPLSQPMGAELAGAAHFQAAADGSRRQLRYGENAPTAVGGYAQLAIPAKGNMPGSRLPGCGLVCCFYRLANPITPAMQWEAIAINADFWSQVLQSRSLKPIDFALGAVMAIRRPQLREIGGFASLVDCLADDYQLGNRIARRGYAIALSPVVVECWASLMGWAEVWKHQLRWARTIRVCQPAPYFFSVLSNATLWPLVWLGWQPTVPVAAGALGCCLIRILTALNLQQRLNLTPGGRASTRGQTVPEPPARGDARSPVARPPTPAPWRYAWLIPLKDLLQAAIWLLAFLGNRIEWRGQRMRLRSDGTLEPLKRRTA